MGQISDESIGAVSWRYTASKGGQGAQNVNDGGTRVMNNGWNDFSGESEEGLYGSLLRISADVTTDPVFGLTGYGAEVSKEGSRYTVTPLDGIGKRINIIDDKIYVELEQDSCTKAVIDESGSYIGLTVNNTTGTEHLSRITLSRAGIADGYYSVKVNGEAGEQCYVSGNEGIAYAVVPAGGSAEITIEKMDGGENQAPKIYSVETEEEPQALVPFRVEASAYDDGAPDGTLTYKWEVTDAPEGAELTFDADDNPYAEVSAALHGQYTVKLTVSDGTLSLDELDFLHDGVMLAVYNNDGTLIAGLNPVQMPDTPFRSELLQTVTNGSQTWYVFDLQLRPARLENSIWLRGSTSLSSIYATRDEILWQCALLFPFLILLSAFGGYLITKKAFQPVKQITAAAERIGSGSDLSQRINLNKADPEIMQLAQTFDSMFSRLEKSFDAERQFTADASHELRTPAAAIIAQAEYALKQAPPAEKDEALQKILAQARKMSRLLAQLLMLARADANKIPFEIEKFDFSEMAEIVIEETQQIAGAKEITVNAAIEPEVCVEGDQTLLMRLLLNLLDNAVKYTENGGKIDFTLHKEKGSVVCSVKDTGCGIAPEELPKIWRRFYQAESSHRNSSGAGLGLSMVQWIANLHGGTITAESTPGEGSTFTFTLPLKPGCKIQ